RRSTGRPDASRLDHFDLISDDFAAIVRDADFVSLHIPGSPENARFISRERLDLLPARAWLINTARGAVVDEVALYDALVEGRLGGAALDVFDREPYEPSDPAHDLRELPQVILLPHVGSNTVEANRRMAERALRNIRLAEAGDLANMDLLNRELLT
ncbi:MAG: NAD(P)-dependent oxidoreductase, partial [Vicinamibacterales bacterium]